MLYTRSAYTAMILFTYRRRAVGIKWNGARIHIKLLGHFSQQDVFTFRRGTRSEWKDHAAFSGGDVATTPTVDPPRRRVTLLGFADHRTDDRTRRYRNTHTRRCVGQYGI